MGTASSHSASVQPKGSRLTIRVRILLGFASLLVLMALLAGYINMQQRVMRDRIDMLVRESVPANEALAGAALAAADNRGTIYRHATATSQEEMDAMEAILARNGKLYDSSMKIYEPLAQEAAEKEFLSRLHAVIANIRAQRGEILAQSRKTVTPEEVAKLIERIKRDYEPQTEALSKILAEMQDHEQEQVKRRCEAMQEADAQARLGLLVGLVITVFVAAGAGIYISGRINRALVQVTDVLHSSSEQVSGASAQVANSSQSLAEGASEQAASLEETSASLEELGGMTKRNSESAQNANTLAREARSATETGSQQVTEMVEAMNAIKVSASNIAAIIKTIDEIAFQTNILALNAAVEAARAGEAGAGFAVVAEEVRNLAQRAASAARETAEKIDDSIAKSTRGAEVSDRVSQSLLVIADKVRQVDQLVGEIAVASKEQSQGLGQIGQAVGQMDQVTQHNASGSEETASAAQELRSQAEVLMEAVEQLRRLVVRS